MRYNAGSEVYTQALAQALAEKHEVHVFTRQENPLLPDGVMSEERDPLDNRVALCVINLARGRDRYRHPLVDQRFGELLDRLGPDIVHVGHLNHLSTSLVMEARARSKPVVFTLHDYWLMCPRGQFLQMYPDDPSDVWSVCDGQEDRKCAEHCYARYFSGAPDDEEVDVDYWASWVSQRMNHIREICRFIDLFIAPSRYLLARFRDDFGLPQERLVYLDYGFSLERLEGRCREPEQSFVFGYIGTHIPAKGIHHLIEAFGRLSGDACLRIWGRHGGQATEGLRTLADRSPADNTLHLEWMGEYRNQDIVTEVFDHCDAIVVPSIWAENSPLVIHEALQAGLPVITADYGGMAEYIRHEENGLLFAHRDPAALAEQMQRLVDEPELGPCLGRRGYLQSEDGNVPSINQHVTEIEGLYRSILSTKS